MTSMALRKYQKTALQHAILSEDEERELAQRYAATKDPAVAGKLVAANQRLVWSVVSRYLRADVQPMDLVQEGNIGLLVAVEKFDATRGIRFATHATWWIRDAIQKCIRRTPETETTLSPVKTKWIAGLFDLGLMPKRGSQPGEGELVPVTPDDHSPEQLLARHQVRQRVNSLIQCFVLGLNGRDLDVFRSRYMRPVRALRGEVAARHKITSQRVSQIEANLLKRLRSLLRSELGEDAALAAA